MILLGQMIILFLLMLVGLVCRKTGLITNAGSKIISGVVVNVANPALILSASINKENTIQGRELLMTAGLAIGVYVFLVAMALIVPKVFRVSKGDKGSYKVMTVFANIGFMGFPVISAVYGGEALLYASFFLIPFNVLIYTWGIAAITADSGAKAPEGPVWKKILNVGVVSCILTIIIYVTRIPVPVAIEETIGHLANLTAPLSMMVIGASLADMDFKSLFTDVRLIIFSLIKLIVIPVIGVSVIKLFGVSNTLAGVCMVMLSTPVASMTAMLAQQYDANYEVTSKGVALTTILAVVTMPLVGMILGL